MSLISLFNGEYYGYVNLNEEVEADTSVPATDALVFLINIVNSNWKLAVGYYGPFFPQDENRSNKDKYQVQF